VTLLYNAGGLGSLDYGEFTQGCGAGAQAILDDWSRSQKLMVEPQPEIWVPVPQT